MTRCPMCAPRINGPSTRVLDGIGGSGFYSASKSALALASEARHRTIACSACVQVIQRGSGPRRGSHVALVTV
jgi:hypothetical protein